MFYLLGIISVLVGATVFYIVLLFIFYSGDDADCSHPGLVSCEFLWNAWISTIIIGVIAIIIYGNFGMYLKASFYDVMSENGRYCMSEMSPGAVEKLRKYMQSEKKCFVVKDGKIIEELDE